MPLQAGYHSAQLAGQAWLFFALYDSEHQRWVVAGQSAQVRTELASRFALHDVATAIALVLALGLAVLLIMRMALAPLDKLAWQVSQRDEHDLRSIDSSELPLELQPLADSINSAFGRLQKAFDREKQFTNDAAHELRTPVAIIQTQLENALAIVVLHDLAGFHHNDVIGNVGYNGEVMTNKYHSDVAFSLQLPYQF